jgi:hypothetical protein
LLELTSDISKLVNLKKLKIPTNCGVEDIPEAISCLQSLQHMCVVDSPIGALPVSFATLSNLGSLDMHWCKALSFPPNLQVLEVGLSFT